MSFYISLLSMTLLFVEVLSIFFRIYMFAVSKEGTEACSISRSQREGMDLSNESIQLLWYLFANQLSKFPLPSLFDL